MAEYKLANGYVLTDEEIEARAREWEDGTWKGQLVELRAGRPRLSSEPKPPCPALSARVELSESSTGPAPPMPPCATI